MSRMSSHDLVGELGLINTVGEPTVPLPAPAGPNVLSRAMSKAWPLADQVLVSSVNFAMMVLLARSMSQRAFGEFALVYSALLIANGFQSTLITQPHNVLAVGKTGSDYRRYTGSTAVTQLVVAAIAGCIALIAGGVAHAIGWQSAPLLFVLAPSIVAWQLQEFVRRVLYTERRVAAALVNDVISYGGQGLAILFLWRRHGLTPVTALAAMAATSALAAAYGAFQLRGSIARAFDPQAARDNWHFGKWLAGGEILRILSSAEMYQYLAAGMLGTAATATLKSAQIIFGPSRLLAFSLGNVLPVSFAHSLLESRERLDMELKRVQLLAAIPLALYCSAVAFYAGPLLHLLYGEKYAGASTVLSLYAVAAFLGYLSIIVSAALQALRVTRSVFRAYSYTSVIAVSCGWLFIKALGVNGVLVGMIVTSLVVNLVFWRAYRRSRAVRGND